MSNDVLKLIQQHYPEYHPIVSMAHIAHNSQADLRLQFECHKAISKYVAPEMKSVDVSVKEIDDNRIVISLFDNSAESNLISIDHIVDAQYEPC